MLRTSDYISVALLLGLGVTAAHALDLKSPSNSAPVLPGVGPVGAAPGAQTHAPAGVDSLATYFAAIERGDTEGAVKVLENAFRNNGDIRAGWRLARDYADGKNGVTRDPARAFQIFHDIVESQRTAVPTGSSAQFVADAAVTMGVYYLSGIPNSAIKADPIRAFHQFQYAAINFADADGQYHLARAYLDGRGTPKNPMLAVKWLYESAEKGQVEAQAEFGRLLVQGLGQVVTQDIPRGLTYLKIAAEAAPQGAPSWIQEWSDAAWQQATADERSAAMVLIEKWKLRAGRPGR